MNGKKVIAATILMIVLLAITARADEPETRHEYTELFETMSEQDADLLSRCLMCEAGYSNIECAEATCCVILNRVLSDRFPDTVSEVVNQRGQFVTKPYYYKVTPNELTMQAIENVKSHGAEVIREKLADKGLDFASTDYLFFATMKQSYAKDHLFAGTKAKGQHHWIGRGK